MLQKIGRHGDAVVSPGASQQEGSGFKRAPCVKSAEIGCSFFVIMTDRGWMDG